MIFFVAMAHGARRLIIRYRAKSTNTYPALCLLGSCAVTPSGYPTGLYSVRTDTRHASPNLMQCVYPASTKVRAWRQRRRVSPCLPLVTVREPAVEGPDKAVPAASLNHEGACFKGSRIASEAPYFPPPSVHPYSYICTTSGGSLLQLVHRTNK